MKDNTIAAIIACIVLAWMFLVSFGLWGGHPKGCFVRIEENRAAIITLKNRLDIEIGKVGTKQNEAISELRAEMKQELEKVKQEIGKVRQEVAETNSKISQSQPKPIPEHKKYKGER